MPKQRRKTPADDPGILDEWKKIHRNNTEEIGMSQRQSFLNIAKTYGCGQTQVYYWMKEKVRRRALKRSKKHMIPYSEKNISQLEEKRINTRLHADIRRNPDIYLGEIFANKKEPQTLDDITRCMEKLTGIGMRNKTLLGVIDRYETKHGQKLLVEVNSTDPPRYVLPK